MATDTEKPFSGNCTRCGSFVYWHPGGMGYSSSHGIYYDSYHNPFCGDPPGFHDLADVSSSAEQEPPAGA